jgi:hypothetical protein
MELRTVWSHPKPPKTTTTSPLRKISGLLELTHALDAHVESRKSLSVACLHLEDARTIPEIVAEYCCFGVSWMKGIPALQSSPAATTMAK